MFGEGSVHLDSRIKTFLLVSFGKATKENKSRKEINGCLKISRQMFGQGIYVIMPIMEVQIQNGNNQLNVYVKYPTANHCSNLTKSQSDKPRAYSFLNLKM